MNNTDILGYSAAAIASIVFWPQAINTIRSKDVDGISIYTIILQLIASLLFLVYGILKNDYPVFLVNVSMVIANMIILGCYLKWNFPKPANSLINKKEF